MDDRLEHTDTPPPNTHTTEDEETASRDGLPEIDPQLLSRPSMIGKKIGACTIKRVIGSGGMGTVYESIQEQPRRRVALNDKAGYYLALSPATPSKTLRAGLEPATYGLEDRCSIQLSYRSLG